MLNRPLNTPGIGIKAAHTAMPVKPNTGAIKKTERTAVLGIRVSLVSSLAISSQG